MKYTKHVTNHSHKPIDILYCRLYDMMNDYDISLKKAIEWDMLGFMPYPYEQILTFQEEVEYYLIMNYISAQDRPLLLGTATGMLPDYELKPESNSKTES